MKIRNDGIIVMIKKMKTILVFRFQSNFCSYLVLFSFFKTLLKINRVKK